ncbi:MAG: serine/threonine-protein kinase [Deltaproteobacteria bacterium]|nr:serine/threonine-protein kinase [Deltaproteobacteria bacterium]
MIKVGERLGRFELLRELGRGSHGVVFEALDTLLNEKVAIKALQPWLANDPTLRERFKRELILTRRVAHPGVCRLHDLHEDADAFFISMQLVEGRSMSEVLREEAPPVGRVIRMLRGICSALAAAHEQGVIHRDLKPANIMVDGKDGVVVLDFGIATAAGVNQLTRPGQAIGSVPFIPPEVWEGQSASALSDQYALGVIGFAAATGTLPYRGVQAIEVVDAIRSTTPTMRERRADVDPGYEAVILKAMARNPADRFANVKVLDDALAALQSGTWTPPVPAATTTTTTAVTAPPNPSSFGQGSPAAALEGEPAPTTLKMKPNFNLEPQTIGGSGIVSIPDAPTAEGRAIERTEEAVANAFVEPTPMPIGPKMPTTEKTMRVIRPVEVTDERPRRERDVVAATTPTSFTDRRPLIALAGGAVVVVAVAVAAALWPPPAPVAVEAPVVAVIDPQQPVVVVDAGTELTADAGVVAEVVADPIEPDPIIEDPPIVDIDADPTVRKPNRSISSAPLLAVLAEVRTRGLRTGDVKELDDAIARAQRAARSGDRPGFDTATAKAKATVTATSVDKAFVARKLARFNAAFDTAKPEVQARVQPISRDVSQRFGKGDWTGANARLNDAFAMVKKK